MMQRVRGAAKDTFRSLQYRNFRLFFAGQSISQIGNWLTMVAQSLLVYELSPNGVALGVLTAFQFLPVLLLGAWAGLVADRSDKRKLMMRVQTIAMAESFALAGVALMDRPPIAAIFGLALLNGVCTAFDNPARRAFVTEMVPEHEVQNAVSLNSAMMTGSRVVGPALAGLMVWGVGFSATFLLDGVSYLAVLWGLWRMNTAELRRPERTPRQQGQVLSGLRYARSEHELWVPLVMMTIIGTLAFNFSVFMPVLVDKTFGRPVVWYTVLMSAMSIGSVVGALITARRREVAVRDLVRASVGFGLALLALAATPWFPLTLPVVVLIGLGSIMFMTTSTTIVQLRCRPEMRGRVLALQAMVFLGSTPIGGPVIGVVSEYGGARVGIVVGGLACLGAAAYGWPRDRSLQAPTHVPVTPPDLAAQIASSS